MKTTKLITVIVAVLLLSTSVKAQTATTKTKTTSKSTKTTKAQAKKAPAAPISRKDITITIVSADEHSVSYFAGPKEDLKSPKIKIAGGLSTNTLYVKENDVVCIIDDKHKPTACTDVKPGTKSVQINSSGNGISRK